MIKNRNETSAAMDKALKNLEQAKARYEAERKKENEKRRKAQNHHKYLMGGIVAKYFPECYQYEEKELYLIIRDYGEDKFAKNIAKHIVAARQQSPIMTTGQLTQIIRESIPMKIQAAGGHPAKRTFQAIRIELNKELDVLRDSLDGMIDLLDDGGRICIITFHSLEDRIVKTIFRKNENPCTCPPDFPVCVCGKKSKGKVITRKPILPSETEMEENPRSKSAKLRIFERRYL